MAKLVTMTLCLMLYFCTTLYAADNLLVVNTFIKEFIEAEFNGDQSYRVYNVINSPARKLLVEKMYKPMIGEIFNWDTAKICVVDLFKISSTKVFKEHAEVKIRFKELGCSNQYGYANVPLSITNKEVDQEYTLKYSKGRWWVYDPPIPRVSREEIIKYNNDIIKLMDSFVWKSGTQRQKNYYNRLLETNELLAKFRP